MAKALLALGGNVGNSRAILDRAIDLLCDGKDVRPRRVRLTTAHPLGALSTSRISSTWRSPWRPPSIPASFWRGHRK